MPHIELHIHTKAGSADSSISVDALGERVAEMETGGIVVAEHFRVWSDWEREAFHARWGVRVFRAVEHTTRQGHVIVIGAEPGVALPDETSKLIDFADERGWMTILAHPFRHYFDQIHSSQTPVFPQGQGAEELADHPFFQRVGAIEIRNADCTSDEKELATAVARKLKKVFTVGSDAHNLDDIGRQRLPVPAIPQTEEELIELLGSFRADEDEISG